LRCEHGVLLLEMKGNAPSQWGTWFPSLGCLSLDG
jgi:hypothetical protein